MSFSIRPEAAVDPLVFAIDVGSSGTRGGIFDATGRPVSGRRHKVVHQFTTAADGTVEVDADAIVDEVATVLETVLTTHRDEAGGAAAPMAGVAIDTFASSLLGVDRTGAAVTPCYTYADSRCAPQVAQLREEYDEAETQQRTGTRFHTSYLPARLRWLQQTRPDLSGRVHHWMSLSEYVHLRLLGTTAAGTSVAAWTGLLDRRTADWDPVMLEACGITTEQLSVVQHPGQPIPTPAKAPAGLRKRTWKLLSGAHWAPGLSDGFVSNLGAGGHDATTAVLSTATSGAMRVLVDQLPDHVGTGLWCYRVDQDRSLVGGALNDVGRALNWLRSTIQLPPPDELAAAMRQDPGPGGPLVLPFLTGERSTGWAGRACGSITGLTAAHDGAAIARGVSEGIAISYLRIATQLREVTGRTDRILLSGRVGSALPWLLDVLADALQAPVTPVAIKRSTLRGTALVALESVAPDVERAATTTGDTIEPHPDRAGHYARRLTEFERVYGQLHA